MAVREARGCAVCAADLPLGPRPLLQGTRRSKLLIIGQAPGRAAHESGVPWDDRSGARLRDWLGLTETRFYDADLVALMPMGLCYPGTGASGDLAPRPECAPLWHARLLRAFAGVELTVYTGAFAFAEYLSAEFKTITEAARGYSGLLPARVALPHPSPRNNRWLARNAWFEAEALPRIKRRVAALVEG